MCMYANLVTHSHLCWSRVNSTHLCCAAHTHTHITVNSGWFPWQNIISVRKRNKCYNIHCSYLRQCLLSIIIYCLQQDGYWNLTGSAPVSEETVTLSVHVFSSLGVNSKTDLTIACHYHWPTMMVMIMLGDEGQYRWCIRITVVNTINIMKHLQIKHCINLKQCYTFNRATFRICIAYISVFYLITLRLTVSNIYTYVYTYRNLNES